MASHDSLNHPPSSSGSTSRSLSPSPPPRSSLRAGTAKRRVIVTPSWARNLPPEFPDEDSPSDQDAERNNTADRFPRSRTVSSAAPERPNAAEREKLKEKGHTAVEMPQGEGGAYQTDRGEAGETLEDGGPKKAHHRHHLRHNSTSGGMGDAAHGGADSRWWTFTLPTKYLVKVQDYVNQQGGPQSQGEALGEEKDRERRESVEGSREKPVGVNGMPNGDEEENAGDGQDDEEGRDTLGQMKARLKPPDLFSAHQSMTPSWSAPWTPFRPSPSHHHPLSATASNGFHFPVSPAASTTKPSGMAFFILHNPFAPLFFRFVNLCFVTTILALSAHIRIQEKQAGVVGVVGTSTTMAIVVCPLALCHIFFNVYAEYFGQPIGLWSIASKMAHTLTELIFICLYSSLLSLVFDDLLTSPLHCIPSSTSIYTSLPPNIGASNIEGSIVDKLCSEQIGMTVLVFICLMLYVAVLVVSLWRIFVKVTSRKGGH